MIVDQVEAMLRRLASENDVDVLVIEQNIGVACAVSERVAIMVNGRVPQVMDAARLASDRDLQQALLGVGRHAHDEAEPATDAPPEAVRETAPARVWVSNPEPPTRWSRPAPVRVIEGAARTVTPLEATRSKPEVHPLARRSESVALVVGTLDTKGEELRFLRDRLAAAGVRARLVDLSTSGKPSGADVPPHEVAAAHPRGASGVFTGDRGTAVAAMTEAFRRWMTRQTDVAGALAAGGSGNTAMVAPGFRTLPLGVPKLIVSTVASGDVSAYVGPSDMTMMHSVADVQGLNSITRDVLANAAGALAGMIHARAEMRRSPAAPGKPAVGLTMFGLTTPCVQRIVAGLPDHDCLVFHATGTGGRSMEALLGEGRLAGVIDVTTTEVADMMMGGVFAADEDRLGAVIRAGLPYVGSTGALDMVNFGAPDTVPERYRGRLFYEHNPQVTLMRTTPEENASMGAWIGERLNRMPGPVRFLLPEGGRLGPRRAGCCVPRPRSPRRALRRRRADRASHGRSPGRARGSPHQRPGLRRCAARGPTASSTAGPRGGRREPREGGGGSGLGSDGHEPRRDPRAAARPGRAGRAHRRRRRRHRPQRKVRGGRWHRPHRHLQLGSLPHGGARLARRAHALRRRQRRGGRDGCRSTARREAYSRAGRRLRDGPVPGDGPLSRPARGPGLRRRAELPHRGG